MVTVIIPIYNAGLYLEECLNSIKQQSYHDFEVICVDDNSTDNSIQIIEDFILRDNRFNLIKKKHSNAGESRNLGMENAKGDYLLFLDGDDYFDCNMLENIVRCAENTDAEITIFNFKLYYNNLNRISKQIYGISSNRTKTFNTLDLENNKIGFTNIAVWNKLYKKSFIQKNNIVFKSHDALNDVFFSWISLIHAQRISLCRYVGTYYRVNTGKSISDNLIKIGDCLTPVFSEVNEYIKSIDLWNTYKKDIINAEIKQINEYMKRIQNKNNYCSVNLDLKEFINLLQNNNARNWNEL